MNPAARALADNPSWSRQTKEWCRVAIWAFGYSEDAPSRTDVARALIAGQHSRPAELERVHGDD